MKNYDTKTYAEPHGHGRILGVQKCLKKIFLPLFSCQLLATVVATPITPEQGLKGIENAIRSGENRIQLAEGLFLLPETWAISGEANGVSFIGAGNGTVLSGAREVGSWERVDEERDLWRCDSPLESGLPVRQLFDAGKGRLPRSRMPNQGWFRGDRLSTIGFDVNRVATRSVANEWRISRPYVFAGLRYREENANQFQRLQRGQVDGAILQTISAWTTAWQPVRSINQETRDMQLFTPTRYPLAHWSYGVNAGGGTPFAVENTLAGIDFPGEWYWNPEDDTITLKSATDPNKRRILVPALETVVRINGAKNIELRNLHIAHSRTLFGRYDQHKDWKGAIQAYDPTFPDEFPAGLTVPQSAPFTGEAIHLSNCRNVRVINCRISGTGGYGIRLSTDTHECVIQDSLLTDLGAGGISIDPEVRKQESDYPTGNIVKDTVITKGGRLHPAACAIRIAESADNRILNNRISHFGYTGITVGWAWNPRPNHTTGNHVIGNDVSHVMEVISDGAGIYTLGSIPGTRIENNYMHDIGRAETAIGAGNSGIFFDQFSKGALIRSNRLARISSWHAKDKREPHPFKHHRNLPSDHTYEGNSVDGKPFEPALE